MKIAVDGRGINLYRGTGIGTYSENVFRNILEIDHEDQFLYYWLGGNYEEYKKENSKIIYSSSKHHNFFEQYYFPNSLKKEMVELYHVPQNGIGLSKNIECKKIATIHDLIPFIMPETVGPGYLKKFLQQVPLIMELSDAVITVSEYSKKDILRFFPIDPDKIFVTPLAADIKFKPLDKLECKNYIKNKYKIDSPFILYVGGFSERKNVSSLIRAFYNAYKQLPKDTKLVIVGAKKDQSEYIEKLGISIDFSDKIVFTGYVEEIELPILYNACQVFVYPSLYEGFGLPPLEAMSCGTPVITSNTTSIPEVVKDAGILINPNNERDIENSICEILCDEKKKEMLSLKGLERSRCFSWKETALKTLEVYKKTLNN